MGTMVSQAGALSGGLEGAAKMTGGFRAAMGALSSPVGLVAVGVIAAGAALFAWSKRAKAASIDNSELEGSLKALANAQVTFLNTADQLAVLEGRTTTFRAQLARIGDTIEREFADKLQEANDPFQAFQDTVDETFQNLQDGKEHMARLQSDLKKGGEAADTARIFISGHTREMSYLETQYSKALKAQKQVLDGNSEEAVTRRALIAGIQEEERNRRKILAIRIEQEDQADRQSRLLEAQSKNDREAIASISREMANASDVMLTNQIQAMKWSASTQIAFLQASGIGGTALIAMTAAINAQTEALVRGALEEANYQSIYRRNLEGMEERTRATADATEAQSNLDSAIARGADLLAQARGELAVINKEHADSLAEITELTEQNAITEAEAAELVTAANRQKKEATKAYIDSRHEELQATHDMHAQSVALQTTERQDIRAHYEQLQADALDAHKKGFAADEEYAAKKKELTIAENKEIRALNMQAAAGTLVDMKAATDQMTAFMDAVIANKTQKLDQEEAAAVARAKGNMEEQEKIRAKFDQKRREELTAAFAVRKGLEISNAIISGASAAIAALAPPPVGAGPVLGPFLAAGIGATTVAQVALISGETPSFHQGGIVGGDGDQRITAQGGEVVLNRSAVADLGGTSAANSLNAGGAAGGVVVVEMRYRNRMFDQMVVDNLAKGGPLKKALSRATRRGRRGRIGGRL
jgi:hypothetical protein